MSDKLILEQIYVESVLHGFATQGRLSARLGKLPDLHEAIARLMAKGLVDRIGTRLSLTTVGRRRFKVVLIGGAFEIIHPGHMHTIREAKRLGDLLVVVVATDRTVARNKGREPATDEATRVELVSSIRHVDLAILGNQGSIYETLEKVRPDIVALGYDQYHNAEEIVREGKKRGIALLVRRLGTPVPQMKTTRILAEFR